MTVHEVMPNSQLQKMLLLYLCRLFSSALGLIDEPKEYGPIRLVCAGEELLDIMKKSGIITPVLEQVLLDLNEKKEDLFKNPHDLRAFLEEVLSNLCKQLGL